MNSPKLWEKVEHFNAFEDWGDPYKMWVILIYHLDSFREYLKKPLIVHCGWEMRDSGWHPAGAAVDLHCPSLSYKDLAFKAMQFTFTGIGLYPCWNNPGVHLDVRPLADNDKKRKLWYRHEWMDGNILKKQYYNIEDLSTLAILPD